VRVGFAGMPDARKLTDPETPHADDASPGGGMRGEISSAMVSIMKQYYGKGPTNARTFFNERYVFCVMEGGLTRSDETLLSAGEEELVRSYRLRFESAITPVITRAVADITGRAVVGYHSQVILDPPHIIEIFILDEPPGRTSHPSGSEDTPQDGN
jgi:uncharacterized protein YbcI